MVFLCFWNGLINDEVFKLNGERERDLDVDVLMVYSLMILLFVKREYICIGVNFVLNY